MMMRLAAITLMTIAVAAHAATPSWLWTGKQDGVTSSIDVNSIETLPDGSISFWMRLDGDASVRDKMASGMEHVIVRCDGAKTYTSVGFVAMDAAGTVIWSTEKRQERPLTPGSIGASQVEVACKYAAAKR
jgi:hypothetical protein